MIHDMPFTDHGCTGCKLENEVERLRAEVERLNTEMDSLPRLLKPHERVIDTRRVKEILTVIYDRFEKESAPDSDFIALEKELGIE